MDIVALIILVIVSNVVFWGLIIYVAVSFWRSKDTGLTKEQKAAVIAGGLTAIGGRRSSSEQGPVESSVRGEAAGVGIDLDDR